MLKTEIVEITAEGRDKGKKFELTEMPALKAERWARHAIAAMSRQDLDVRSELSKLGMLGFILVGFQALAGGDVDQIDKLMDEMLPQIKIVEPAITRPIGGDDDIAEVQTLYTLRKRLIELHMSFTFAELALMLATSAANNEQTSSTASTSPTSSPT